MAKGSEVFFPFKDNYFPLYLAPMARFTDFGFRALCKEQGADILITEFVMADAIIHGNETAWSRFEFDQKQRPIGVQIFGSSPDLMGEAAAIIEDRIQPDFIDINFGCPADKVTCKDAGSSLLRNLKKLGAVAAAVVKAVPNTAVTAKIRIGWDAQSIIASEAGKILQDVGIRCLTIHGRTKDQGYSGSADWSIISAVHDQLEIPVVGNGDIQTAEDVIRIQSQGHCDGVMIGRAALGYPWLFKEIRHYLNTKEVLEAPKLSERWRVILNYCRESFPSGVKEEQRQCIRGYRPKIASLTKEMIGCKRLRPEIMKLNFFGELIELADIHLAKHEQELEEVCQ